MLLVTIYHKIITLDVHDKIYFKQCYLVMKTGLNSSVNVTRRSYCSGSVRTVFYLISVTKSPPLISFFSIIQ